LGHRWAHITYVSESSDTSEMVTDLEMEDTNQESRFTGFSVKLFNRKEELIVRRMVHCRTFSDFQQYKVHHIDIWTHERKLVRYREVMNRSKIKHTLVQEHTWIVVHILEKHGRGSFDNCDKTSTKNVSNYSCRCTSRKQ